MFVVRVENDEATMYRAFRHWQTARSWAAERNLDDLECLVDIFEAVGEDDAAKAVAAIQSGKSRSLLSGEAMMAEMPVSPPVSDIDFTRISAP